MSVRQACMNTCSPDGPTESAVARALVDLEWRREAAGKRNGNTHRVNTREPQTAAAAGRRARGCCRHSRASSWKEMVLEMNGQRAPSPSLCTQRPAPLVRVHATRATAEGGSSLGDAPRREAMHRQPCTTHRSGGVHNVPSTETAWGHKRGLGHRADRQELLALHGG